MIGHFSHYKSLSPAKKAAIWYTICNILQKGISFIVVPIYVRMLTTAEYGDYMAFQAWRDILIIIATLNLYCGVYTKALVDYENDRDRYTSSMLGLGSTLTVCLFFIYLLSPALWQRVFEMDAITLYLLFAYFLTFPAISFWSVRQRVEYKYIRMVVVTLLLSLITPIISILLLLFTNLHGKAVIYGFLIVQDAFGLYFFISQLLKGRCLYQKDYWLFALKFNIPLIPHYLSLIILGQVDRIMIKSLEGSDKAGIYSLAYQVSMIMTVFTSAINGALVPWVYERLKNKIYDDIHVVSNQLCLFVGAILFFLMLIGPELIGILATSDYYEAIWIIPAVAVSLYFNFVYGLFSNVEFYYGATVYVMIASMTVAVLKVLLNFIFIPTFGYISAGYTTLVCYFAFMMMHYLFMRKVLADKNIGHVLFDIKTIGYIMVILLTLMLVCLVLYNNIYMRIVCIVIMISIAIYNRAKVRKLLNIK